MVSARFAALLAAGRPELNRRAAEARRRSPAFDPAAFSAFVSTSVDAVVGVVDRRDPERAGAAAFAAYDIGLALAAQARAGTAVEQAWADVAPRYGGLLAAQPAAVLGLLTNAALHLEKSRVARVPEWLALMAALAPQVTDLRQLRVAGQISAWRSGLAHFRQGALAAGDTVPEPLALAAFGIVGLSWPEARDQLRDDPWWTTDAASHQRLRKKGIEIGGFTGFGGAFGQPPEVRPAPDGFWVRSGEHYALLIADACGAVLQPASEVEYTHHATPAREAKVAHFGEQMTINGRVLETDLPTATLRVVCNARSAAITSPYSHAIRVLPLP
jgi:hypothetical protein